MEWIINIRDIVFLVIGFIIGVLSHMYFRKESTEHTFKVVLGIVVLIVWGYNTLTTGTSNWWVNIFMGLVLSHFFELNILKKNLENLIKR